MCSQHLKGYSATIIKLMNQYSQYKIYTFCLYLVQALDIGEIKLINIQTIHLRVLFFEKIREPTLTYLIPLDTPKMSI